MKRIFYRSFWFLATLFMAILFAILYIGKPIALGYAGVINEYLNIETSMLVDDSTNETPDVMYYKPDFMQWRWQYNAETQKYEFQTRWNKDGLYSYLNYISEKVNEESTVLLKNENNALPLAQGAKISIFGVNQFINGQSNYITTGLGSGYVAPKTTDTVLADTLAYNGVEVNEELTYKYQELISTYKAVSYSPKPNGDINVTEFQANEAPMSAAVSVADSTIENYGDCAIYTISRLGAECGDTDFDAEGHVDNNYLDLTEEEISILDKLAEYKADGKLKSIVLLLNTCTAVQFKTIAQYPVDAILYTGTGGSTSFAAIADVLTGEADPNGHLADTYLYDNYSAPSTVNMGDFTYTESAGVPKVESYTHNNKYLVYQEGIYVGYKYYETRYEDMVMNAGNAVGTFGSKNSAGNWTYEEEVAYPFGYGSSYATFEQSDFKVEKSLLKDAYEASVTIKNVSDVYSGKDTFQLYLQKPYTEYDKMNGVEKAAVELVGVAKTKLLAPGESQTLTISIERRDFASYDSYGAKTYILEKGDYYLTAGLNSHDAINNIVAAKGAANLEYVDAQGKAAMTAKIVVDEDDFTTYATSKTGETITNQFDDTDLNLYEYTKDEQNVTYLTRNDWAGTYPQPVVLTCTNAGMLQDMQYTREIEEDPEATLPTYGAQNGLSLIDLMYEDYDSDKWDKLLDQLTKDDLKNIILKCWHTIDGVSSVNAPGTKVGDAGAGIRKVANMAYPGQTNMACTYNPELIQQLGEAFGMELNYLDYKALWGPGANIHRNAFGGRNFEYLSEDGVLSGIMLNAEIRGLTNMGIITYTKHLTLNDQERNRYGGCTWANEQSIREIYLKPFQITIETDNDMVGVMGSFNRLGCTWSGMHKGLLTNVLRKEWGFKGAVVTDCAVGHHMGRYNSPNTLANAIIAGNSLWLSDVRSQWNALVPYLDNAVVAQAVRQAAKDNLYSRLHSSVMNGMKSGMKVVELTPWWIGVLDQVELIVGVITAGCAVMMVASFIVAPIANGKNNKRRRK